MDLSTTVTEAAGTHTSRLILCVTAGLGFVSLAPGRLFAAGWVSLVTLPTSKRGLQVDRFTLPEGAMSRVLLICQDEKQHFTKALWLFNAKCAYTGKEGVLFSLSVP